MTEKDEPVRLEVIRVDEFGEPSAWVVEGKLFGRTATGEVWSDWLRSVGASSLELDLEHPTSVRAASRGASRPAIHK